jgi:hypothetical protein
MMRITRITAFVALAALVLFAVSASADGGGVCGEDGTVSVEALQNLGKTKLFTSESGAGKCAGAFFARACAARGAPGFTPIDKTGARATHDDLSCFAPVCAIGGCSDAKNGVIKPRGGFWEADETEPFATGKHSSERAAKQTLCSVCSTLPLGLQVDDTLVNVVTNNDAHGFTQNENSARVGPIEILTTGWYASWLTFLAVDAIVAASLGFPGPIYVGSPYWIGVHDTVYPPHANGSENSPVVQPVIIDNVFVDPYWSPSVVLPEITGAGAAVTQVSTPTLSQVAYPWYPPPPAVNVASVTYPSPPPPPDSSANTLCTTEQLTDALPAYASSLIPCLGGASGTCCGAIAELVGPFESAALQNCLCNPNAFVALGLILNEIQIDLQQLLVECDEIVTTTGSGVAVSWTGGGSSDGSGHCDGQREGDVNAGTPKRAAVGRRRAAATSAKAFRV